MELTEFFLYVVRRIHTDAEQHGWREGQSFFNFLAEVRPELAKRMRSTCVDPFFHDKVTADTWGWVVREW